MARFLERFKSGTKAIDKGVNNLAQQRRDKPRKVSRKIVEQRQQTIGQNIYGEEEEVIEDDFNDPVDDYDAGNDFYDANIQKAQKPESFHHFILDNKFQSNEKSIRGYKDVYNKETDKWEVKRKAIHCFTDEEAESIVRMAQAHLGTDIKLAHMSLEAFGHMMNLIYDEFERFFSRIMEYRYGRYGSYELQSKMKDENLKILVELYNCVWANYSRAIGGSENKLTHDSVKSQESLQQSGQDDDMRRGYT